MAIYTSEKHRIGMMMTRAGDNHPWGAAPITKEGGTSVKVSKRSKGRGQIGSSPCCAADIGLGGAN